MALGVALGGLDRTHDVPDQGVAEQGGHRKADAEGNRLLTLGLAGAAIGELIANQSRNIPNQSRWIDALRSAGIGFSHGPPCDESRQSLVVHGVGKAFEEFDARILGPLTLDHFGDIVAQRANRPGVEGLNQTVPAAEVVQDCRVGDAYVSGDFLEPDRIGAALGQKPLSGIEDFFSCDLRASAPPRNRRPGGLGTFCHV